MTAVDWYFDFISPFAWLQLNAFDRLPEGTVINYKPLLFAGLLGHWEHKGPAEIPAKRVFTYQHTLWLARKAGIAMTVPQNHPFNPLPYLRLAVAAGCTHTDVVKIFRHIWVKGSDPSDEEGFVTLGLELGVEDPVAAVKNPAVKTVLLTNGEEAIERGIFGVPTFYIDGHLFWGYDATDMALDYLNNPQIFFDREMMRAAELPIGVTRI
ncbi:MAG: 2-hydroxychromene-2-carboxylate isomerase [Acidobacteriota bacterium]|nr:2-hydroxychromene-2-carboxylate isomerase [Acidobacteriota bacterium]